MQRSKYEVSNTAEYSTVSDKQSVKQDQNVNVQNVPFVLVRMPEDLAASARWPSR